MMLFGIHVYRFIRSAIQRDDTGAGNDIKVIESTAWVFSLPYTFTLFDGPLCLWDAFYSSDADEPVSETVDNKR